MRLTAAKARELWCYDPDTGAITWRKRNDAPFASKNYVFNCRFAGKPAGVYLNDDGYPLLRFRGRTYFAHRVIWLMVTGKWPKGEIDHIDHDRQNRRFANLREVSPADNRRNKSLYRNNTSGAHGVAQCLKTGRWKARIYSGKRTVYLGSFGSFAAARDARKQAEQRHGFHPNHGAARGVDIFA